MMRPLLIRLWLLALLHVHLPEQWHHLVHQHEHRVHVWDGSTTFDTPHQHCITGWDYMMPAESGGWQTQSPLPSIQKRPYFIKDSQSEHRDPLFCRMRGPPLRFA